MFTKGLNAYVIDIEANELYPFQTDVWTICIKRVGSDERIILNPFRSDKETINKRILDFIFREPNPTIIGHNFLGFDGWVLWRDFGLDLRVGPDSICNQSVSFFDTLFASQFFLPDRGGNWGGHSLEDWGENLGTPKINYRQVALDAGIITEDESEFCRWSPQMDEYCEKDCDICENIFLILNDQLAVEGSTNGFRLGQKTSFLMSAQAFTGFKFDQPKANELKARIEQMILDLKNEVEPELPPRWLKKSEIPYYQMPAKPYVKDGSFSATMNNFVRKHNAFVMPGLKQIKYEDTIFDIEPHALIKPQLPMLLDDQADLKEYFLSIGWVPTLWNVKKDRNGKPVRDEKRQLIKTSPKFQENHQICSNLLELDGELPKKIVKFMSLRNRLGILTGWLADKRLAWDGRLSAGSVGIASTHRQKHTVVVNIPKAQDDVLLGKEFRSLFTVDEGNKLVGCDQATLEARCEAHWVYKYPGGVDRANILISGDLHSINAKIFFPKETKDFDLSSTDFNKEDPGFKPYRSLSKNGAYALAYGCTPNKLSQTLRKPEREAKPLYEAYWGSNPSLKTLKDKIETFWVLDGDKVWIPAIDGRRLHSRSKHSLVNLLFQSTGAIIVDYALCLFDTKMGGLLLDDHGRPYYNYKGRVVKRVEYMHDEAACEVTADVADEIATLMEWAMGEAGVKLKLNIPLIGEAKIGMNWAETH